MKSIRTKALICLLVLTVTLCSNLKRESESLASDGDGNWATGYNCPNIMLNISGKDLLPQGRAKIQGKLFVDPNNSDNKQGLVIVFKNAIAQNSLIPQVATQISGNKYSIPWRYVTNTFEYTNPNFSNKFIKGKLQNDQGTIFDLSIVLPYNWPTGYINDEEGNLIRKRINEKGSQVRSEIVVAKNNINTLFPAYTIQKQNILTILNGVQGIDKEVGLIKKDILKKMADTDLKVISRKSLRVESKKIHQNYMNLLSEIKNKSAIMYEGNANILAIRNSIESLEKGKKNPTLEISKAKTLYNSAIKKADSAFVHLAKDAKDKENIIIKAAKDFAEMKTADFAKGINSIAPN